MKRDPVAVIDTEPAELAASLASNRNGYGGSPEHQSSHGGRKRGW